MLWCAGYTATQNEGAHSYHKVRGLYFLAVVFKRSVTSKYRFRPDEDIAYQKLVQYKVLIGWQAYRGDQIQQKNSPT